MEKVTHARYTKDLIKEGHQRQSGTSQSCGIEHLVGDNRLEEALDILRIVLYNPHEMSPEAESKPQHTSDEDADGVELLDRQMSDEQ